jgi:nicotinamidase/pyrazinamidase
MKVFIVVDIQNDFCPGGALAVAGGNEIIPLINKLQKEFELVVATQDWHPRDHGSFASNQGKRPGEKIILAGIEQILWPDHCVQGSYGAEFVKELDRSRIDRVFHKGDHKEVDSYSGFFDNDGKRSTGMAEYLRQRGVTDVYIAGLATDYCVQFTAIDAVKLGFRTFVMIDACRGVNLVPGDVDRAIENMRRVGVVVQRRES